MFSRATVYASMASIRLDSLMAVGAGHDASSLASMSLGLACFDFSSRLRVKSIESWRVGLMRPSIMLVDCRLSRKIIAPERALANFQKGVIDLSPRNQRAEAVSGANPEIGSLRIANLSATM